LNKKKTVKEWTVDIVKDILAWIIITALAFLYWIAMLLIFSLILLNVWHTTIEQIIDYTIVLTVVTSLLYLGRTIYRRVR
jgi:hypothetical protein